MINPGCNREQKLGGFSRYVPIHAPIGIGYLTAYLTAHGKTVKILDGEVSDISAEVLDRYVKNLERPYIFGLSVLTAGITRAHRIAALIKGRYPDSKVIFGNVHPTVMAEEVLKDRNITLALPRTSLNAHWLKKHCMNRKHSFEQSLKI